jgi:ankyrin repeat protein
MSPSLPLRPSLEWLRKTAKDRLAALRAANPRAKLADAQLAVARQFGFPSWRALKAHVERAASGSRAASEDTVASFLRNVGTGRIDAVQAMLADTPALVNAVGPHPFWGGRPQALHVAIEAKRRDVFDLLLARAADPSGTNDQYDWWSPLMLAIDRDRPDMRDDLLARGARVGLLEALMLGDDGRVDDLLRGGLPDISPNAGSILAFARTPFAIDRLLGLGASAEQKDRWGSTPIDALSRLRPRGQALVRHLVARGVPAAPKEYARMGDLETLTRLVDADPAIARLDAVMMGAVDFAHYAVVEWLLARGADPNARSDAASRHTALHSAAWKGDLRMVKLLVGAGADPAIRDDQYDATPQGWADTAIEVTNNPACAQVVTYLAALATDRT